jgi:iron(III) transport system substrate-binding protein
VRRRPSLRTVAAGLALFLATAACGGSPTADTADSGSSDACDATSDLGDLSADLADLSDDDRREELIRLAIEEGGQVNFYGSTNPEDMDPVIEAFQDDTGVAVNNYRADTNSVMSRIQEEAAAGRPNADVTIGGRAEYTLLGQEGLLADFETPISEQIHEGGVQPDGVDVYRVLRIPLWNTDRLSPDEYPTSWEDVLENYPGEMILDPTDWDWFATFVQTYLMDEKGMTEDEAIEYMTEVAQEAVVVKGHTLGTQLVTTGENAIAAVTYQHGLPPEDAPVKWEPLWPVIEDSTVISILECSPRPASAMLFTDYMLSDAQPILYEGGRSPANTTAPSTWPAEYNDLTVPIERNLFSDPDEANRWMDLYEQVLTGAEAGG